MPRRRNIPPPKEYEGNTAGQILDVATKLFAQHGFRAVSQNDIAKAVGVSMATLYHHYESKDALFTAVLRRYEESHNKYNAWLKRKNEEAATLEEVMDNLFNNYFLTGLDTVGRLGMRIALKEQHSMEAAHKALLDIMYRDAAQSVQAGFDRLIEKGVLPPSNTKSLAVLFILCVMSANDLHVHEAMSTEVSVERTAIYAGLRQLMTSALVLGTLPAAE